MNALIQPGRILAGRYRIDQQIGVGGMAVLVLSAVLSSVNIYRDRPQYTAFRRRQSS